MQGLIFLSIEYVSRSTLKHYNGTWDFKYIYVSAEGNEGVAVIAANSIEEAADKIATKLNANISEMTIDSPIYAHYHLLCNDVNVDNVEHWRTLINLANKQIERLQEREQT